MAKPTKKTKRATPRGARPGIQVVDEAPAAPPSQEDFKRARDLLRGRADKLILDLAKSYLANSALELTTVLDALDSLAEFDRLSRVVSK